MSQTDKKIPVGTIDCTPTWEGILKTILVVLRDGNAEAQKVAIGELQNMAKVADMYVEITKNPPRVLVQIEDGIVQACISTSDRVQVAIVEIDDQAEEPVVVHDYTQMTAHPLPLHTAYTPEHDYHRELNQQAENELKALNF